MLSSIKNFYNGQTIFFTGATGFIGKVTIEKLLRSCDEIKIIYILIRSKNGVSAEQRAVEFLNDRVFTLSNVIDLEIARKKIIPIIGDLSAPGIGISNKDRQLLINTVTIVIHCAGDIKFDYPLRHSVTHNLIGSKGVLELSNQIKHLNVLIVVSTLCVVTTEEEGDEKVYPPPVSPEHVIETVEKCTDKQLKQYRKIIFSKYPNTYTIAKSLAEQLFYREKGKYNIAIVRPSAVNPSYREPIPGWIDVVHGPIGVALLMALGLIRVTTFNPHAHPGQIPVDMAANAVITAGWYIGTTVSKNADEKQFRVYNVTTLKENSPSLSNIAKMLISNVFKAPSIKCLRPMTGFTDRPLSRYRFKIHALISHWFFAYFIASLSKIVGFKTQIINITKRMEKAINVCAFFANNYDFKIDNTRHLIEQMSPHDRREFDFDVRTIDWLMYYEIIWLGLRRYLLKERDEDIPKAKKRFKRFL